MSETKHTPGPWRKAERLNGPWWHISSGHTVGGQTCKDGLQAVACVHGESKRGSKDYAEMFEANALLIAAAPELLEKAQAAMAACERMTEQYGDVACGVDFLTLGNALRAAIAKATTGA